MRETFRFKNSACRHLGNDRMGNPPTSATPRKIPTRWQMVTRCPTVHRPVGSMQGGSNDQTEARPSKHGYAGLRGRCSISLPSALRAMPGYWRNARTLCLGAGLRQPASPHEMPSTRQKISYCCSGLLTLCRRTGLTTVPSESTWRR